MSSHRNMMTCPLCGYKTDQEYAILLHMEELHAEGDSLFMTDTDHNVATARDTQATEPEMSNDEDGELFVECPVEGCLEQISLAELEDHIEFHTIELGEYVSPSGVDIARSATDERGPYRSPYSRSNDAPSAQRGSGYGNLRPSSSHDSAVDAWKKLFRRKSAKDTKDDGGNRSSSAKMLKKRLGKSELGKHAYETQMPQSLVSLLKREKYRSAEGIVPVLAKLLEENSATECAYLCHPAVQHISKLRGEGGFCGYRNIQMLSSYMLGANVEGAEKLGNKIPSIFQIQDFVENAWDMGINASGRIETGGIKGTRKYIGTPEAQAMFIGLEIACEAEGFKSSTPGDAEKRLLGSVEQYFKNGVQRDPDPSGIKVKIHRTNLPPIYFQHHGHSLTIVGFERRVSGSLKLLVFDPMFRDSETIVRLAERAATSATHRRPGDTDGGDGTRDESSNRDRDRDRDKGRSRNPISHRSPDGALRLYRRGNHYLRKYIEFELLRLKITPRERTNV